MEDPTRRYRVEDFRHEELDEVDSTNTVCLLRARAGDAGPLWVTAHRQSGGRGRRGRAWVSERGNLYASLLLVDPAPVEKLPSLPIAVALALYRAVSADAGWLGDRLKIKWPNDLLVDGKKLSGILIETEKLIDGRNAVVIGCGVNILHRPDNPLYPAITLREAGATTSAESLFAYLMREMAAVLAVWDGGRGIAAVVAQWKEAIAGLGQPIRVNLADRSISGIFSDIDAEGILHLRCDDGQTIRIASGDVFLI